MRIKWSINLCIKYMNKNLLKDVSNGNKHSIKYELKEAIQQ